jgi:hypothetical protein
MLAAMGNNHLLFIRPAHTPPFPYDAANRKTIENLVFFRLPIKCISLTLVAVGETNVYLIAS